MADIEKLIVGTKRPERTVEICTRGDLQARFEDLQRDLVEARKRDENSFDAGEGRAVADRMKALQAEMVASTVILRFRAMPRLRPFALLAEHPPRPDEPRDAMVGFSEATYYTALIRESCTEITHPDGSVLAADALSDEIWESFFDELSNHQFDQLVAAANIVNNRDVDVPFSHLASQISPSSEAGSRPPKNGASRRSGSKAGSQRSRRSTSTTTPESSSAP